MTQHTIQAQWDLFRAVVLPSTAPPIQQTETRRAFYAGFYSCLKILKNIGDEDLSEETGGEILNNLELEVERFAKNMLEGRA